MARFKAVIIPDKDAAPDKKYPLYIRVTNMRLIGHIPLKWYVCDNDFNHDIKESGKVVRSDLKDRKLRMEVDSLIEHLEELDKQMFGPACHLPGATIAHKLEAKLIAESLKSGEIEGKLRDDLVEKTIEAGCFEFSAQTIDFIKEFNSFIEYKLSQGKKGPAQNYSASLNHLLDFINKDNLPERSKTSLPIADITFNFLNQFEKFLQDECRKKKCSGKRCISLTMSCLRKIFNECTQKYNDEDKGIMPIKHYPFKRYKIVPPSSQLDRSVDLEIMRKILRAKAINERDILAQKYFALSTYLLGMHCADFYQLKKTYMSGRATYKNGRLSYERSKTRETRRDNAFITFKVPKEAKGLIDEFLDKEPGSEYLFIFHKLYVNMEGFRRAVNIGLSHLVDMLEIEEEISSYTPRCTLAKFAEENLGIPKSDIALFLNHSSEYKMTEIYTKKNFKKLDKLAEQFVDYINSDLKVESDEVAIQPHNQFSEVKHWSYEVC